MMFSAPLTSALSTFPTDDLNNPRFILFLSRLHVFQFPQRQESRTYLCNFPHLSENVYRLFRIYTEDNLGTFYKEYKRKSGYSCVQVQWSPSIVRCNLQLCSLFLILLNYLQYFCLLYETDLVISYPSFHIVSLSFYLYFYPDFSLLLISVVTTPC